MPAPKKSLRSSRMHTSPAKRKKKISLPVHITRVKENEDPITLKNPFTIHPLPTLEDEMTAAPSLNEVPASTEEKVLFDTNPEATPHREFREPIMSEPSSGFDSSSSITTSSSSVLDLPPAQFEEVEQSTPVQEEPTLQQQPTPLLEADQLNPKDLIKVNFATFVELVASQDVEKIIEQHTNQELIMSTNLLSKLASLRDNREEKKIPLVFLVGIAIGVVLTYIFFSSAG